MPLRREPLAAGKRDLAFAWGRLAIGWFDVAYELVDARNGRSLAGTKLLLDSGHGLRLLIEAQGRRS
jgi:hypothetical protein